MLKKRFRLAKTKDVKQTFERGRSFFNPFFTVKVVKKPGNPARFTVVVSTKVSKKAVARNRLKRILREYVRLHFSSFISADYAIVVKPRTASLPEPELLKEFEKLLKSAKLLM